MLLNIWLVCQYYKPEPGAPSARLSGFAHLWQHRGHYVDVLTAVPNHPKGIIPEDYQGKSAFLSEKIDDVNVHRHWLYVTPNEGFIKKTLSHITFALSLLINFFGRGKKQKPDVIVASSPAFFAAFSAWLLSVRYRVPFVMEVRDLWPGIFVELGVLKPGFLLWLLERVELFLYRRAAAVVTVTQGFKADICRRGIEESKVHVITNGVADHELDAAQTPRTDGRVDKLRGELQIGPLTKVILFIGTHGTSQALGQVIDAARLMMHRSDLLFLFVGDGADKVRLQKLSTGMPNVQFIGSQPKENVFSFINMSTACLVPLKDIPGFATFIPSKMFEIMACGTVAIGCLQGEAAQIMETSGGSVVVPPEQPEKLAKAIETLVNNPERLEQMGEKGRQFVSNHYRHSRLGGRYLEIFHRVTGKGDILPKKPAA